MGIRISVQAGAALKKITDITERTENLKPVWQASETELRSEFNQLFASGGYGRWDPYTLIDTGRLRRSFIQPNADNVDRRSTDTWEFGSAVPYAQYYEALLINVFIDRSPVDRILRKNIQKHLDS